MTGIDRPLVWKPFHARLLAACLMALWFVAIALTVRALMRYETTPGAAAIAPASWPDGQPLARPAGRWTLVVIAHPRCACTRATLAELALLLRRQGPRLRTFVVMVQPERASREWTTSGLWSSARALDGVTTLADRGGRIARRFGSRTSGQALLYDPAGHLAYSGGLTGARGHIGDNPGLSAVSANLDHGSGPATAPVYGCALETPSAKGAPCPR